MLDRVKAIGGQLGGYATDSAGKVAAAVADASDAAVRAAARQLGSVLRTAAAEIEAWQPLPGPVTLTAAVGVGSTSLQATVVVHPPAPAAS